MAVQQRAHMELCRSQFSPWLQRPLPADLFYCCAVYIMNISEYFSFAYRHAFCCLRRYLTVDLQGRKINTHI